MRGKPKPDKQTLHPCWICGSKAKHVGYKGAIDWKDSAWCSNEACENAKWFLQQEGTAARWQRNALRHKELTEKLNATESLLLTVFGGCCQSCSLLDYDNTCRLAVEPKEQCPGRGRLSSCDLAKVTPFLV